MGYFPQPDPRVRAPRVRVPNNKKVGFSFEGKRIPGALLLISRTGGLAQISHGVQTAALAELNIQTRSGSITALVELLPPVNNSSAALRPFRFIALSDEDQERLASVIKHMHAEANGVVVNYGKAFLSYSCRRQHANTAEMFFRSPSTEINSSHLTLHMPLEWPCRICGQQAAAPPYVAIEIHWLTDEEFYALDEGRKSSAMMINPLL